MPAILSVFLLFSCSKENEAGKISEANKKDFLVVKTTYAGTDSNARNYQNYIKVWQEATGISVLDTSENSSEEFKAKVKDDFKHGREPDVLFFFTGADSSPFIEKKQVVPIDEIRSKYPDYASNMNEIYLPMSLADGKKYAVPVNGYWEGLYYNSEILKKAGAEIPDENTTIPEFIGICKKVRAAGFIPVAAALGEIPHYWWEFMIFNAQTPTTHNFIPRSAGDSAGKAWTRGLSALKELYEAGCFEDDTLTVSDSEIFQNFTSGKAAFLLQGSWKCGGIARACSTPEELEKFGVTFFPKSESRRATDLIGGVSMGYFITRKAWQDDKKREAAVKFISYMTSDAVVSIFAEHTMTALKNGATVDPKTLNSLQIKAVEMTKRATSITGALQDLYQGECRKSTFDGMPDLLTGKKNIQAAVQEGLDIYYKK